MKANGTWLPRGEYLRQRAARSYTLARMSPDDFAEAEESERARRRRVELERDVTYMDIAFRRRMGDPLA